MLLHDDFAPRGKLMHINGALIDVSAGYTTLQKSKRKVRGVSQSQAAALLKTPRGNRQNQTSATRTNVRKVLSLRL